jgi:hypothetical protein
LQHMEHHHLLLQHPYELQHALEYLKHTSETHETKRARCQRGARCHGVARRSLVWRSSAAQTWTVASVNWILPTAPRFARPCRPLHPALSS